MRARSLERPLRQRHADRDRRALSEAVDERERARPRALRGDRVRRGRGCCDAGVTLATAAHAAGSNPTLPE